MSDSKSEKSELPLVSREALHRYLVVSSVRVKVAQGKNLNDAVEETASEGTLDPSGTRTIRPKPRTIRKWLKLFGRGGIHALERKLRETDPASTVLTDDFVTFLCAQRKTDARASVPEIIRRARAAKIIDAQAPIDRTTVWRVCQRLRLETPRMQGKRADAQRPWGFPNRGMMMLIDGKHFRAGLNRAKRVAFFYLDDHSRKGLDVKVAPSENTRTVLLGLHQVIERFGFFDSIFVDRGPGFIAKDTAAVVARMERNFILGAAKYPEGRGKIERFNLTAGEQALRGLDRNPAVDDDCGALELYLRHWLYELYNQCPHESLDHGKMSPQTCWDADSRELEFPESAETLRRYFILTDTRRVTRDNVIPIHRVDYEVPPGHRLERITVCRYLLDDEVRVLHGGELVRVLPVDRARNAMDRRPWPKDAPEPTEPFPQTAAAISFRREYGPVVDADGSFEDRTGNETNDEKED